jgi:hypothetical protein
VVVDAERTWYQLAVVFQGGWRIVHASPEGQALLDAHGVRRPKDAVMNDAGLVGARGTSADAAGGPAAAARVDAARARTAFVLVSLRAQLVWPHDQGEF